MSEPPRPPRLNLRLGDRLRTLLLINVVPLCLGAVIALGVASGRWGLRPSPEVQTSMWLLGGTLLAFLGGGWFLLPLSNFCNAYCTWRFKTGNALQVFLWCIPAGLAWFMAWTMRLFATVGGGVLLLLSLWSLWRVWAAPTDTVAPAASPATMRAP